MNLDQTIVNWAFGISGGLGTFVLNTLWDANKQLRNDNIALAKSISDLSDKINRDYVRRDDYRADISEIKGMLSRIFDKLDDKQDKP